MHSWWRASGHNSARIVGSRFDPSVTTTSGESPQVLRFLRNRRMWGWSLLATRAKATGRSFSGSVASSKVILAQVQLVDAERPAEVVQDPAAVIRQVEPPDLPVEAVVDEPVREIQKEVPPHRGDDPLDAYAVLEDAVEHGLTDLVVVQRPAGVVRNVVQQWQRARYSP